MPNYGQQILDDGLDRLQGSWDYAGETFDLVVKDISYSDWQLVQQYAALSGTMSALVDNPDEINNDDVESIAEQAENLDDFSWEDDSEDVDFVKTLIDEKLLEPQVDLTNTSSDKVGAIVEGMFEAWQEAQNVQEARQEMPLDEGNR